MNKILLFLALGACVTTPVVETPPPPPQDRPFVSWPSQEWAKMALEAVRTERLAQIPVSDGKSYCPQGLTERNFVHLLAAMAKYESNFKPALEYREGFKNGRGETVISTGLLQLSYESARGYGFPGITTADLKDPAKNLAVGARILGRWLSRDGVVSGGSSGAWKGAARYWSTMRSAAKTDRIKRTIAPWCE